MDPLPRTHPRTHPQTLPRLTHTSHDAPVVAEARRHPRLKVSAPYSLIRVRLRGRDRYKWTGHVYDVSEGGLRFELDAPLPAGSEVEVRVMLPGDNHTTFRASGRVVRLHDHEAEDAGPVRMAMTFDTFANAVDQHRLAHYLDRRGLRLAA